MKLNAIKPIFSLLFIALLSIAYFKLLLLGKIDYVGEWRGKGDLFIGMENGR